MHMYVCVRARLQYDITSRSAHIDTENLLRTLPQSPVATCDKLGNKKKNRSREHATSAGDVTCAAPNCRYTYLTIGTHRTHSIAEGHGFFFCRLCCHFFFSFFFCHHTTYSLFFVFTPHIKQNALTPHAIAHRQ